MCGTTTAKSFLFAVFVAALANKSVAQESLPPPKPDSSNSVAATSASQFQLQFISQQRAPDAAGFGVFVGADYQRFKTDTTTLEDGSTSNTNSLTVLVDYTFSRSLFAGGGARFGKMTSHASNPGCPTRNSKTVHRNVTTGELGNVDLGDLILNISPVDLSCALSVTPSDLDVDLRSFSGYVAWSPTPPLSIIGSLEYGEQRYNSQRNIVLPSSNPNVPSSSSEAHADYRGQLFTAALVATYDVAMEGATFTPFGKLVYSRNKIDAYEEAESAFGLGFAVDGQVINYLNLTLGSQARYAVSSSFGVFIPQVALAWTHEFKDDKRIVAMRYVNDPLGISFAVPTNPPDRDYFRISPALLMQFQRGISAFIVGDVLLAYRDRNVYNVSAGIRWEL